MALQMFVMLWKLKLAAMSRIDIDYCATGFSINGSRLYKKKRISVMFCLKTNSSRKAFSQIFLYCSVSHTYTAHRKIIGDKKDTSQNIKTHELGTSWRFQFNLG